MGSIINVTVQISNKKKLSIYPLLYLANILTHNATNSTSVKVVHTYLEKTYLSSGSKYAVSSLINSCSEYLTNHLSFINLKKKIQFILQKIFMLIKNNSSIKHSRITFNLVRTLIIINCTFENPIVTKLNNNNLFFHLMESIFINKVFSVLISCILKSEIIYFGASPKVITFYTFKF